MNYPQGVIDALECTRYEWSILIKPISSALMDTQKAIELIEKSEHIAFLLPPDPGIDCIAAAEVLARALEDKGKTIGFLPTVEKDHAVPPPIFRKILNPAPLTKEFIVSLNTAAAPISQLRYEKHDDRIDIILSPKSSPVRQDLFSFREGNVQCDCIIAFTIADIETIAGHQQLDPRLLDDTPIINIDTAEENRRYADVNLVIPEKASSSEIVYALLQSMPGAAPAGETATIILAGIMDATDSLRAPSVQAATLNAASSLLASGANYAVAQALARSPHALSLLQLASRAAVRSKEDAESGTRWSFLTAEDFEKTGRSAGDVSLVLTHLSSLLGPAHTHALLWQDPEERNIRATLHADTPFLEEVAIREPGTFHSPYLTLALQFPNFQDAEERIALLLKEVI